MEIETLKSIFVESELEIKREKPYNFEIILNSNTENEERNFLKLKIIFDLPEDYPNEIPYFRIKNLSVDYIDNNAIERFAEEMRERAQESVGQMMIFELVDLLKDKITTINEKVLNKLDEIEEKESIANQNKEIFMSDLTNLSYTPVNAETFAAWCEQYKEKIRLEKLANRTENEDKPTGKQLFLMNRSAFDDIVLEATMPEDDDEVDVEEGKADESDEGEFVYDRALYDADGLEDEDIDFDD